MEIVSGIIMKLGAEICPIFIFFVCEPQKPKSFSPASLSSTSPLRLVFSQAVLLVT